MNFCKNSDEYISLYIDNLLEDKKKQEFVKHIEVCSECADKLKSALEIVEFLGEAPEIELPENFSSSLHKRLIEVNNKKEQKSRLWYLMQNKKFAAGLSTACILAFSLVAYNLLPQFNASSSLSDSKAASSKRSISSEQQAVGGQIETFPAYSSNQDAANKSITNNKNVSEYNANDSSNRSLKADSNTLNKDTSDLASSFDKNTDNAINKQQKASDETNKPKVKIFTNGSDTEGVASAQGDTDLIASFSTLNDNYKYYSNYSEFNLSITAKQTELQEFKEIMKELGAVELTSNKTNNTTESVMAAENNSFKSEYIEYSLALSLYNTLQSKASENNLSLSIRMKRIIEDITNQYIQLEKDKTAIDKKISEAEIKGQNTISLKKEKTKITNEINLLSAEKDKITIRTYLIKK